MKNILAILIVLFSIQDVVFAFNNPLVLINKDLRDGVLSDVEAVELKTRTLLIPESLPDRYQFADPAYIPCGLGIIDEAEKYYDQLPNDLQ